jgi:hypothetical protein
LVKKWCLPSFNLVAEGLVAESREGEEIVYWGVIERLVAEAGKGEEIVCGDV